MLKLKSTKKDVPGRESLLVNFSSKSRYAESYRTLRTNIYFSMMEKDLRSIIVTSSLPGEGKTTTVANLAYTIAQTGKKVLMVDADLRKPGLSQRFGLQKATGFSNLIADLLGRHVNKGTLTEYSLRDLVQLHTLQQRTCVLNLNDDINEVELFFLKGELLDIYWKNRPDNQKLATTLIRQDLLSEEEAKLALGHQKKSVRRLGSVLINLGLVEPSQINKILSIQMMEAFKIATEMREAEFSVRSISEDEVRSYSLGDTKISELSHELLVNDESQTYISKKIDSAILSTEEKNLYLLPSGSIPPNPSELIGSARTAYLLSILQSKFDVVIADSSPIIPASDALLLAPLTDGVVFVVQVGGTSKSIAKDATSQLQNSKANILGVLLNKADLKKDSYYKYKYYQSYYGG